MREDRRIRKTKDAIKNSFFLLLSHKPINQITVKEIVQQADINRSTFYHYYLDVADMLTKIEEEIFGQFVLLIEENFKKKQQFPDHGNSARSLDFLTDICTIAKENQAFCRCLFRDNGYW